MANALAVYAGSTAAERLRAEGWSADLFDVLIGASGGAKWLILGHLDRVLFGSFLAQGTRPLHVLGSSVGSWRHTSLVQEDPVAAIERFESAYLNQQYSSQRPSVEEITQISGGILDKLLGPHGIECITSHQRIHSHIVTARGRGPTGSASNSLLATGMGAAALGNTVSRHLLQLYFQRVVFHSEGAGRGPLEFGDFDTQFAQLNAQNTRAALYASGSIPFILSGERDIPAAPPGMYWDGGIIDYHFDLHQYAGNGLLLYPHFSASVVRGWFDKFLPWRKSDLSAFASLVLLCPTREFIADLPHGKIPDRSDFKRMGAQERVRYWEDCIERSRLLADEFTALVSGDDPLSGVTVL